MEELKIVLFCLFIFAFLIVVPLQYREGNSIWFTFIKFYFVTVPFMIGGAGILCFGVGVLSAVSSLITDEPIGQFFMVTYLYLMVVLAPIMYLKENNKKISDFLETL